MSTARPPEGAQPPPLAEGGGAARAAGSPGGAYPVSAALLDVQHVRKHFPGRRALLERAAPSIEAVDDVSFSIAAGETLGLVGESGSGKSTLGRAILQLDPPTGGRVLFDGEDVTARPERELRGLRRRAQMIFQDPNGSFNPRMKVGDIIAEPLVIHGLVPTREERRRRVAELLDLVRLPASAAERLPNEFSGGQRQRIGIARAIAVHPDLIIADEAVSALDVSIQAQILNLLAELQARLRFACLFVAHDLAVVRHVADRVAVMYLGRLVELAPGEALFADPRHSYTRALLESAPIPDPAVEATRPRAAQPPPRRRYPVAMTEVAPGHFVSASEPE
jgi:oligopeptide transport system ATP-binding protein